MANQPTTIVQQPRSFVRPLGVGVSTLPAEYAGPSTIQQTTTVRQATYEPAINTSAVGYVNDVVDLQPVRDVNVISRPVNDGATVKRTQIQGVDGRAGVYNRSTGCPWWCWLIVGLVTLLLLGGLIAFLLSQHGGQEKQRGKQTRVEDNEAVAGADTESKNTEENTEVTKTNTTENETPQ